MNAVQLPGLTLEFRDMHLVKWDAIYHLILTKEGAREIFNDRRMNRPMRKGACANYTKVMNAGLWRQLDRTQTPLLFDQNQKLAGGQHRVKAFIDSDLEEIRFPVVLDATIEEIENQDANIPRSVTDKAAMFGAGMPSFSCFSVNRVAAITKVIRTILDEKATPSNMTPQELQKIAADYTPELQELNDALDVKHGKLKWCSAILAAFVLARRLGTPRDIYLAAVRSVDLGVELRAGSALYRLRSLLEGREGHTGNAQTQRDLGLNALQWLKAEHKGTTILPGSKNTANRKHLKGW